MSGNQPRFFANLERPLGILLPIHDIVRMHKETAFLVKWLVRETLRQHPDIMTLPQEEFVKRAVPLDENVLREALKLGPPRSDWIGDREDEVAINDLIHNATMYSMIQIRHRSVQGNDC